MDEMDIRRNYYAVVLLTITICLSTLYYFNVKPNAYKIVINNKVIGFTESNKEFEKIKDETFKQVSERFGTFKYQDNIYLLKTHIDNELITEDSKIEKAILDNSISEVPAFEMKSDDKTLGFVASTVEGGQLLDLISKYYLKKNNIKNPEELKIKNNITYNKMNIRLNQVKDINETMQEVLNANENSKVPRIIVSIKEKAQATEAISPATVVNLSQDIPTGQSQVSSKGENGSKVVSQEITMENDKIVGTKLISEKVISQPKNTVITRGATAAELTQMGIVTFPSRGFISSGFGMRWGRMHEGIDIAANMGTPIYAAMAGQVIYAGWEEGYGNCIQIKASDNVVTLYGHCSKLNVKVNDTVNKGDLIGNVGSTGNSTGPHVHFEVRMNGKAVNPIGYINR